MKKDKVGFLGTRCAQPVVFLDNMTIVVTKCRGLDPGETNLTCSCTIPLTTMILTYTALRRDATTATTPDSTSTTPIKAFVEVLEPVKARTGCETATGSSAGG